MQPTPLQRPHPSWHAARLSSAACYPKTPVPLLQGHRSAWSRGSRPGRPAPHRGWSCKACTAHPVDGSVAGLRVLLLVLRPAAAYPPAAQHCAAHRRQRLLGIRPCPARMQAAPHGHHACMHAWQVCSPSTVGSAWAMCGMQTSRLQLAGGEARSTVSKPCRGSAQRPGGALEGHESVSFGPASVVIPHDPHICAAAWLEGLKQGHVVHIAGQVPHEYLELRRAALPLVLLERPVHPQFLRQARQQLRARCNGSCSRTSTWPANFSPTTCRAQALYVWVPNRYRNPNNAAACFQA